MVNENRKGLEMPQIKYGMKNIFTVLQLQNFLAVKVIILLESYFLKIDKNLQFSRQRPVIAKNITQ